MMGDLLAVTEIMAERSERGKQRPYGWGKNGFYGDPPLRKDF